MLTRFFRPGINAALLVGAGALLVGAGVSHVGAVHRARAAEQRACRAELAALRAGAFLRDVVAPADPCVAVQIVGRGAR